MCFAVHYCVCQLCVIFSVYIYIAVYLYPNKMPRQKKDPNKPKGKMSAYAFFVQSEREAIRSRYKESGKDEGMPSLSELSKFCSEKWKCLDDSKKTPFLKLAAEDKARYEEEMATYVPSEDDETPKKSRKRKRQVDENHPKRNRYVLF